MTDKELLDAGYKRYDPPSIHADCVTDLYQKCIKDDTGKRYFISIERWDFSRISHRASDTQPSFETTVQFTHKNGETVDITCYNGWEIDQIEKFYDDLWKLGWFKYYEKYWSYEEDDNND